MAKRAKKNSNGNMYVRFVQRMLSLSALRLCGGKFALQGRNRRVRLRAAG
jgi:hypothetical protein